MSGTDHQAVAKDRNHAPEPAPDVGLPARLRQHADEYGDLSDTLLYEDWQRESQADLRAAADEIEQLRAENAELKRIKPASTAARRGKPYRQTMLDTYLRS